MNLATERYKLGINSYLNVTSAQTTCLVYRQTLATLRMQQMTVSFMLVESVGGGWGNSLPSHAQLISRKTTRLHDDLTGIRKPTFIRHASIWSLRAVTRDGTAC